LTGLFTSISRKSERFRNKISNARSLAHGWMSLVGGGPYPAPPAMDPNYKYQQVVILLTGGLNTKGHAQTKRSAHRLRAGTMVRFFVMRTKPRDSASSSRAMSSRNARVRSPLFFASRSSKLMSRDMRANRSALVSGIVHPRHQRGTFAIK
jgi:hypothetical protein